MDAYQSVITKLKTAEFAKKPVPKEVKLRILEAARLTASGVNKQHWRFILVQDSSLLKLLAPVSTTGKWVEAADFAVIVLTNPKFGFHMIDAGRVVQNMEIAAWNFGVSSRVFTGLQTAELKRAFNIPDELNPTIV
jgi:nitroreductase